MTRFGLVSFLAALTACGSSEPGSPVQADASLAADTGTPSSVDRGPSPDAAAIDTGLKELASWMSGRYSSANQAKKDADFFAISLVMRRIWRAAGDTGYWLYVEQAMEGQTPYRQRVYRLERVSATTLVSKVYELRPSDAQKAVGAWKEKDPLAWLKPTELAEKDGCGVYLTKHASGTAYTGETKEKTCLTSYQGASYTTSRVELTASQLASWDRGWDTSGVQVWGAVKGPYIFDKLEPLALE
jgi:hypothetical protein